MKPNREAVAFDIARTAARGEDSLEKGLADCVSRAVRQYLEDCGEHEPDDLYAVVRSQVEQPLFQAVFEFVDGNQTRCAKILGVSRGTVRQRLREHKIF